MAPPIAASVVTDLHRYFNVKAHSDITIILNDRKIHAHKLVLVLSSKFFRAALEGGFKEADARELSLLDDDPEAMAGLLRYFYGLKPHDAAKEPGIYFDLKLFAVAGKYDVPDLLAEAENEVQGWLAMNWQAPSFPQVVFDIYESIPAHGAELRTAARIVCREHLTDLMLKKDFKETMLGSPELQFDIVKSLAAEERLRQAKEEHEEERKVRQRV
ncbi:hypothetical protein LTR08_006856 [Meristemomyces frigidus]|nr:hypothetical protein LTR08_006856 [Meristemomyces frigidus]